MVIKMILKKNKNSQGCEPQKITNSNQLFLNKNENKDSINEDTNFIENRSNEIDNYESFSEAAFMEIAPLDFEINNEIQKDLSSISLSEISFPKIVYLIVDSKIEFNATFAACGFNSAVDSASRIAKFAK